MKKYEIILNSGGTVKVDGDGFDASGRALLVLRGGYAVAAFSDWVSIVEVQAPTE